MFSQVLSTLMGFGQMYPFVEFHHVDNALVVIMRREEQSEITIVGGLRLENTRLVGRKEVDGATYSMV
jgi:hypothetical protein